MYSGCVPRETSMSSNEDLNRIAGWLGADWSDHQRALLMRYQTWLLDEALPAGGVGSGEERRIFDRHIADSLAFLPLVRERVGTLIDVGSGVGLPAIPIAIARQEIQVVVIDRSQRRSSLASRALRILKLSNVTVRTCEAAEVTEKYDIVTFRASLPVASAALVFKDLAATGGEGLFALSRKERPDTIPDPPEGVTFGIEAQGAGVLDSPAWFLRMRVAQDAI